MTEQEAIGLVSKVCAEFNGNLNDHQAIQQALKIVLDKVKLATELEKEQKACKDAKKEVKKKSS